MDVFMWGNPTIVSCLLRKLAMIVFQSGSLLSRHGNDNDCPIAIAVRIVIGCLAVSVRAENDGIHHKLHTGNAARPAGFCDGAKPTGVGDARDYRHTRLKRGDPRPRYTGACQGPLAAVKHKNGYP